MGILKPNVEKLAEKLDVEALIKALEYKKDDEIRAKATIVLGRIGTELGDERVIEPLIKALGDTYDAVRGYATKLLGEMGKAAIEPLIKALESSDWCVRAQAANALGLIGDKKALKRLKKLCNDDEDLRVKLMTKTGILMIQERIQR